MKHRVMSVALAVSLALCPQPVLARLWLLVMCSSGEMQKPHNGCPYCKVTTIMGFANIMRLRRPMVALG